MSSGTADKVILIFPFHITQVEGGDNVKSGVRGWVRFLTVHLCDLELC